MSKRDGVIESFDNFDDNLINCGCQDNELAVKTPKIIIEMIAEIISHLSDIEDLRNCMLLSREIRYFIYRTPEIMRKIQITFKSDVKFEEIYQFLSERGKFIRNIKIQENSCISDPQLIPSILKMTPNLERFIHAHHPEYSVIKVEEIIKNPFNLIKLKELIIETDDSGNFIENAKNIKNLETLKCFHHKIPNVENMTNFLCLQEGLKELSLGYSILYAPKSFPIRDVSKEIKFKLKTLSYSINNRKFNSNFVKFLENQAENLASLTLFGIIEFEVFEIIFKKCKKLQKLSIFPQDGSYSYTDDHHDWILSNLKFFESEKVDLNLIYKRFPNVDSIKCSEIDDVEGKFEKLLYFDVEKLNSVQLENIKLPNLKKLTVGCTDNLTLRSG